MRIEQPTMVGILLIGLACPTTARANVDPSFSVSASHLFGSTRYRISFPYVQKGKQDVGRSELEYPLGVFLGGVQISLGENPARRSRLSLIGALRRNIDNPGGAMSDSDWINSRLVSYTESRAGLTAWQATLRCRFRVMRRSRTALAAEVGYRYSRFSYKLYGLEGWYDRDWFGEGLGREIVVLDAGLHVLDYRVSYQLPTLGLVVEFHPAHWLETELGVHVSPHASATDFDDHLLRNKNARATATGSAFVVSANLQANLPSANVRREFFFELRIEWTRIETDGDQTQDWYGDDPASSGVDDTGARVSGIDDEISADIGRIAARVGWRL